MSEVQGSESTNVAVGGGEPLSISGSQGPSFDDLAAVKAPKPNGEKFAANEGVEKKDSKADTNSQQKLHAEKEPSDKREGATKDDKPAAETKAVRTVKAKAGESELELAVDTVIPTKVAGKLETPTLEELQADYSGRVNWNRKYKEFSDQQSAFLNEKAELNSLVETMMTSAKDDPFKFFDVVGEITGQDSVALKMQAIDEQIELGRKFAQMSPQQIEQFKKDMALKFREDTLQARETRIKNSEQAKTRQAEVAKLQQTYNMDEDTWNASEEAAREVYGKDVTKEQVVHTQRYLMVLDAMNEVNPDLVANMTEMQKEFAKDLTDFALKNPGMNAEDLKDIIAGRFTSKRGERLAQKIRDANDTKGRVRTSEGKGKVLFSFDQV